MKNPLLQPFTTKYQAAPFTEIKEEHFLPAFQELIKLSEKEIDEIVENQEEPTFENVIEALAFSGEKLERVSGIFFNLNSAETNDEIQKIAQEVSPLLTEFSAKISQNSALFEKIKKVFDDKEKYNLNDEQQMLLNETYKGFVRSGALLNGKTQSGTSEMTDEMSFTVNDFKDGIYDISINLTGKRNSQSANGKTVAVDTKQAEPKDEQLKMMWKVNKALVGNKLNLKMNEAGKVISITGFDTIYNKIAASVGSAIKDAKDKTAFINNFKQSFNEKMLKDQFTKNLVLIPAKGVKIGEKWSQSENATPDGKIKLTTTYTLKSVGDGTAQISVAGGIPKKSDKQTQEGVTRSMSSELSQNGTITLDQKTGWVKNQNISVKTTQTETLTDGKQSQTMKSVSNSMVVVNPAK